MNLTGKCLTDMGIKLKYFFRIFVMARVSFFFILSLTAISGSSYSYLNEARANTIRTSGFFIKENQMKEIFKDVSGYEGRYQVSNYGNVKSLPRKTHNANKYIKEKILKPCIGNVGYKMVSLSKNGKGTLKTLHRLIAQNFIPNPDGLPCVNHIDGNKLNNYVGNLEWVTYSGNIVHAFRTGLMTSASGERAGMSKLTSKDIYVIRYLLNKKVANKFIARIFNVNPSTISSIKRGKIWKS